MDKTIKEKKSRPLVNKIPDYDYLFNDNVLAGLGRKRKSKLFGKIVKINIFPIIASLLLYLIQALPTWTTPIITANIINIVTNAISSGVGVTAAIWKEIIINALILIVAILINAPVTIWRWKIMSKMLRETSAGIKSAVVRKLQSLSITYHKDMQTGKVQSKFLKDTDAVDSLFNSMVMVILPNILGVIVSTVISFYNNGFVALFFLVVIPCNVGLTRIFQKRLYSKAREYRRNTENVSTRLTTMLEMIPVTKAHGLEQTEIKSVNRSIRKLAGAGRKMDQTIAVFGTWMWIVSTALSSLCLIFCAILALLGQIQIGDIVLYQSMFGTISGYVSSIVSTLPVLSSGFDAADSVSEIMNSKDVEANIGKPSIKVAGEIEFKNVSYKYPNSKANVIENFSLKVKKGECIAVVGASGSGKSTLMNMIIGFMMPDSGELLIDGKSIKDVNLSEYRHHISVVPQNSMLFAGSIRDNITYGLTRYSEEDLQKVVEMANLNEFLKELPNGIDTDIGERGDKLSGGQKQRVTIARALIRNPSIFILDEATSALDNISEYHVQKAIESSIKGRTTFIVAHRLSTIRGADRIVVMEQGVCVETGTYDELMAKKGKFFELKSLNDMNLKTAEQALN